MNFTQWLLVAAEWIGTVAFAFSGAATAIERGLDIFGVLFMGLITAMGGGIAVCIIGAEKTIADFSAAQISHLDIPDNAAVIFPSRTRPEGGR